MSSINDQVTDALTQVNTHMIGSAPSQSLGLLDITGAETLGMSMYNAITAQQNSQTSSSASATATCAKILQSIAPPPKAADDGKKDSVKEELAIQKTAVEVASQLLKKQFDKDSSKAGKQSFSSEISDEIKALEKKGDIPGLSKIIDDVTGILTGKEKDSD